MEAAEPVLGSWIQGRLLLGEEEGAFLGLKSQIAQEYESLMVMLASEAERDDRALRLLNGVPSLSSFKELPEGMSKKLATEWHGTYMGLQALLGRLRGREQQLRSISTFAVGMRNVFANPIVILLIMIAAAYGVYRFAEEWIPKLTQLKEQMEKR